MKVNMNLNDRNRALMKRHGGRGSRRRIAISIAFLSMLTACGKPVNPNDLPVSHWASAKPHQDGYSDECSVASAQAIVKSGLPFPNFGTKDELAADGKTVNKRITTVDFWMGGTRFVFPAELARTDDGFPAHNPNSYHQLGGTLPHFYPKGEPAPNKDGMGAMVDVNFVCSMEPKFAAGWSKGYRSNEEGIRAAKARYESDAERIKSIAKSPPAVSINQRDDLEMIEVLFDRGGIYNDKQPMWEATYWPIKKELRGLDGGVSGIRCETRNDPDAAKRYGNRGWTCGSSILVSPRVAAVILIYVSHIEQMPSVFEQVKQVIINAKKAGE